MVNGWEPQEASLGPRLQESGSHTLRPLDEQAEQEQDADMGIPPTQRISQVWWFLFASNRVELTFHSSMVLVSLTEKNRQGKRKFTM